jgi:hypothetical protein
MACGAPNPVQSAQAWPICAPRRFGVLCWIDTYKLAFGVRLSCEKQINIARAIQITMQIRKESGVISVVPPEFGLLPSTHFLRSCGQT